MISPPIISILGSIKWCIPRVLATMRAWKRTRKIVMIIRWSASLARPTAIAIERRIVGMLYCARVIHVFTIVYIRRLSACDFFLQSQAFLAGPDELNELVSVCGYLWNRLKRMFVQGLIDCWWKTKTFEVALVIAVSAYIKIEYHIVDWLRRRARKITFLEAVFYGATLLRLYDTRILLLRIPVVDIIFNWTCI